MENDKVDLPSLDKVDATVSVALTVTVEQAVARIGNVTLTDPAQSKEFLQKLLDEVEVARKNKASAGDILNLVTGVISKVLLIV
jgi:hypothetical protein